MPYSALSDITAVFPLASVVQLTDGSGSTPDAAKVTAAITSADALIDGFLRSRYTLPLASTPPMLIDISVNLAICNLHGLKFAADLPEAITKKEKAQIDLLLKIQKGVISLGIEDVAQPATAAGIKTNKTAEDRVFSKDKLSQW